MKSFKLLLVALFAYTVGLCQTTTPWSSTPTVAAQTRLFNGAKQIRWLWGTTNVYSVSDSILYFKNIVPGIQDTGKHVMIGNTNGKIYYDTVKRAPIYNPIFKGVIKGVNYRVNTSGADSAGIEYTPTVLSGYFKMFYQKAGGNSNANFVMGDHRVGDHFIFQQDTAGTHGIGKKLATVFKMNLDTLYSYSTNSFFKNLKQNSNPVLDVSNLENTLDNSTTKATTGQAVTKALSSFTSVATSVTQFVDSTSFSTYNGGARVVALQDPIVGQSDNFAKLPNNGHVADGGRYYASNSVDSLWYRLNSGALNPKWWGAHGDVSHDDYSAIQKCISALYYTGGDIVVPDGGYIISQPIVIKTVDGDNKPIRFRGSGINSTFLYPTFNTGVGVVILGTSTTNSRFFEVSDLTVQASGLTGTDSYTGSVFLAYGAHNSQFYRLKFYGFHHSTGFSIQATVNGSDCYKNRIQDCTVDNCANGYLFKGFETIVGSTMTANAHVDEFILDNCVAYLDETNNGFAVKVDMGRFWQINRATLSFKTASNNTCRGVWLNSDTYSQSYLGTIKDVLFEYTYNCLYVANNTSNLILSGVTYGTGTVNGLVTEDGTNKLQQSVTIPSNGRGVQFDFLTQNVSNLTTQRTATWPDADITIGTNTFPLTAGSTLTNTVGGNYNGSAATTLDLNLSHSNNWQTSQQVTNTTGEQYRFAYDVSNYTSVNTASNGIFTVAPTGANIVLAKQTAAAGVYAYSLGTSTSTATQKNSNSIFWQVNGWSGSAAANINDGFVNIASTSVNQSRKLTYKYGMNGDGTGGISLFEIDPILGTLNYNSDPTANLTSLSFAPKSYVDGIYNSAHTWLAPQTIQSTTQPQLSLNYDGTHKWAFNINSAGNAIFTPSGGTQATFQSLFNSNGTYVNRVSTASSTATQGSSYQSMFQVGLWTGTAAQTTYDGFINRASTSVNLGRKLSWLTDLNQDGTGGTERFSIDGLTGNTTVGGVLSATQFNASNFVGSGTRVLISSGSTITESSGTGFVKATAGVVSYDNSTYLTTAVTSVTSANTDIGVATTTTTPVLTFNKSLTGLTNYNDITTSDARYLKLSGGTVTGPVSFSSSLSMGSIIALKAYTVATLPASPAVGSIAFVSDALTTPTYYGTPSGGGTINAPVFYTGVSWVYH